jgi:uncharacterized circularly permuted ATP-grasp superfamily protein
MTARAAYDEAFAESGQLRPTYAALRQRWGWDPLRPPLWVAEQLRDSPLGDDTRILPLPWAIDDTEFDTVIRPGIAQRARALQMFFADAILGPGRFLDSSPLTEDLFDEILASEGRSYDRMRRQWASHGLEEIRFVYGPDLVRDPDGRWTILEDNVGCVGGSADSFFVSDAFARAAGLSSFPEDPRTSDLSIALDRWLSRVGQACVDDGAIAIMGCESGEASPRSIRLRENARRQAIIEALGIQIWDGRELDQLWRDDYPDQGPGAVINFAGDSAGERALLHEVGFGRLHVPLLNAPGTGSLGNKALLPYVDDMIRFFCAEEPILTTATTRILRDDFLPDDLSRWVVKLAAGSQGTGVFVLGTKSQEQLTTIWTLLSRSWPDSGAVAQVYVEPSRLSPTGPGSWDAYRLELRSIAYVLGWKDVHVSDQPVGKAVAHFDLDRLNNISRGACYVAVIRV